MVDFRISRVVNQSERDSALLREHWALFCETLGEAENFSNFNSFYRRLFRGQFLVTKNNFQMEQATLCLGRSLKIAGLVFLCKQGWPSPGGVGCLAMASDVTETQIQEFWLSLQRHYQSVNLIAPFAGHHYLGFSIPERHSKVVEQSPSRHSRDEESKGLFFQSVNPQRIGVMTTSLNSRLERLFSNSAITPAYRHYYSLETDLAPERIQTLHEELLQPSNRFRVRKLNPLRPRRELDKMNQLVNACFTNHFDFCPLSDDENWDLMKWSLPLFQSGCFLFLMDGDQEIGFAFGMLDYNQIFKGRNDLLNIGRLFLQRTKILRGRLIHIGILPKYRGQKLVKYLRHHLLLNLANLGALTIESSYIDQDNVASLGNVESTGAKPLHVFTTYLVAQSRPP